MANLGISWRFGDKDDRDTRKARAERMPQYADGPISSVYVLQDEMAALQRENAALKAKNVAVEARVAQLEQDAAQHQADADRIARLEAQVQALLAR